MHQQLMNEFCGLGRDVLERIPVSEVEAASQMLSDAKKVYVVGVGHSGMFSRILSMKLNHVGLSAFTLYDEINPPFTSEDILVAVSQSGSTATIVAMGRKAKRIGGRVLAVTSQTDSALGELADYSLVVPYASHTDDLSVLPMLGAPDSRNARGAVFGFNSYILFYAIVMHLAEIRGETPESIDARHANLE